MVKPFATKMAISGRKNLEAYPATRDTFLKKEWDISNLVISIRAENVHTKWTLLAVLLLVSFSTWS